MSNDKRYLYLTRPERTFIEIYFENAAYIPMWICIQESSQTAIEGLTSFWSEFTSRLIAKFDTLQNGGAPILGKPVFLDHLQQEAEILIRCRIQDLQIVDEAVYLMNSYIEHVFQIAERSRKTPPSELVESFFNGAPDLELQYEQLTLSGMMLDTFIRLTENHENNLFRFLSKAASELKSELGESAEITENNILGRAFAEIKSVDERMEVIAEIPELFKAATSIDRFEIHPENDKNYWNLFTKNIYNGDFLEQFLEIRKIIGPKSLDDVFCAQVTLEVERLGNEISKEADDGFWREKLDGYGQPKHCADNTADVANMARQYIETCFLHALRGDDVSQLYGNSWADSVVKNNRPPQSRGA